MAIWAKLSYPCAYLKRVPTLEDCLGCQRPECVHDVPDGRWSDTRKPRSSGKAGALSKAQ